MPIDNTAASWQKSDDLDRQQGIAPADRKVLRRLGGQVAELAHRSVEAEKQELWYRLNTLAPIRPVVFCDPENGWGEILDDRDLDCTGVLARRWEYTLRKEIWWATKMNDDRVTTNIFRVGRVFQESDWGVSETRHGGAHGGAYRWDAPLQNLDDLSMLRFPKLSVDHEATLALYNLAEATFGDVLKIQVSNMWWWTLGLTWTLISLRGLEQMMLDMYDNPQGLHRLMSFLRDGTLAKLDYLEDHTLLSLNNRGDYVGSGGFGWTDELPQRDFQGRVRTLDMWGFGESQETVSVHPEMFGEFVFPYQLPILERFGLNCYGCCEPLDRRWHIVKQVPRLRRVSVSPWCDLAEMADKLNDKCVLSFKHNPAWLATTSMDREAIRKDIREALATTRGCCVEIIMKDNNTIGGNPQHVIDWVRIVKEEAERI